MVTEPAPLLRALLQGPSVCGGDGLYFMIAFVIPNVGLGNANFLVICLFTSPINSYREIITQGVRNQNNLSEHKSL